MTILEADARTADAPARQKIVDTDVHPRFNTISDLYEYLPENWLNRIRPKITAERGKSSEGSRNAFAIPKRAYFHPGEAYRVDAYGPQGELPGADLGTLREQLLDQYQIDYGIIVGQDCTTLSGIPDPDLAAAFASAYNDFMLDRFVKDEPRLKLSIWVGPRDPALAVKEIHRLADHPGVVQIQISPSNVLLGNRHFHPIYEAAVEHNLPIGIHGGPEGAGVNGPLIAGMPTYYMEVHSGLVQTAWAHLTSLVVEGTFERFPSLNYVIQEMGYAWIPAWMWRLDKEWRSLRNEVPWLKRPPSEYVLSNVKFTSQPIEEPPRAQDHTTILEMMHASEILMFSTDYPHWDFDNPDRVDIPEPMREAIYWGNAAKIYGLK